MIKIFSSNRGFVLNRLSFAILISALMGIDVKTSGYQQSLDNASVIGHGPIEGGRRQADE
jgi:hypothetical protein